jgi:hypothetical protein
MFCSVSAVSDPVADTPLVIDVRCTGAVFGFGGAVLVVHATTPLATSSIATPPRAARNAAGLCHRPKIRPCSCCCARCLDIRTLLPPVDHSDVGSWPTAVP